jgi:glutamate/tyrosine decarboxylase-like PLP-dependent enzyme
MLQRWQDWLAAVTPAESRRWQARVQDERIEQLGLVDFFARHGDLRPPVVLAPVTAHYSWSKGMKLLGLGREQLLEVPERGMRMDVDALEAMLEQLREQHRPVLMTVAVLGTTEFGTIDPVHSVVAARDRHGNAGFGFAVHADAAWGGYLAALLRAEDGGLRPLADLRDEFAHFPSENSYAAIAALADCDSITVDPHKMGYLPYGAGAFVCRDQRAMALLSEDADYVFGSDKGGDYFARFRKLGRFILEGSKSGAAAAAVYVTHRVLPLNHEHFGRLIAETIRSAETFVSCAARFAETMSERLQVSIPFAPDSNLVCLALNPRGNTDVAVMNAFIDTLYEDLRCDPNTAMQTREFFGSITTLRPQALGEADMARVLAELGLNPATLLSDRDGADRLVILRHTLMNPFLNDRENGISYIERYFDFLKRRIDALLAERGHEND